MTRQYYQAKRKADEKPPFPSPKHLLVLLVLTVLCVGGYTFFRYLVTESRLFVLKEIEFRGNKYLKTEEISKYVHLPKGVRMYGFSTDSLTRVILENPYLQGVSVTRSLPSKLVISVHERKPIAYILDQHVYMVDAFGKILRQKPGMSLSGLPLITGIKVQQLLKNREPLMIALDFLEKTKTVDADLLSLISEIHMSPDNVPQLYLVRGGARVVLGAEKVYTRLYLLSQFMQKTAAISDLESIRTIDLRYDGRIIVTRKG